MPDGSAGVRATVTVDAAVDGFIGIEIIGASTPTHRTHACVTCWGMDWLETGLSLLSVHPSGQQILSTLTSMVNATRMRTATVRNSEEYIPARVVRTRTSLILNLHSDASPISINVSYK